DGSEWTVSQDWDSRLGLAQDILQVSVSEEVNDMRQRFKEEPVYLEVIDLLMKVDEGKTLRERRRARHRAKGYMMEEKRLWQVNIRSNGRSRARVECVP
ncbi:hypothetical protein K435DRAFT_690355, partial [Dendrothele bispora CBS 962.96]